MINSKVALEKSESIQSNLYRTQITNDAFDTICSKNDVSDAIDSLLKMAANTMDMDAIHVYEVFGESHKIVCTFSVFSRSSVRKKREYEYLAMKNLFEKNPGQKIIQTEENVIMSAIMEDGIFKGFVTFEQNLCVELTNQQRRDIALTVNVLGAYLVKLRVIETIREKLSFIKNYDGLTKLPTLHKFKHDVRELLEKNKRGKYAIVYLDFKNFKYINESIGEEAADGILIDFGQHLMEHYSLCHCIGRVESDRFVALLPFTRVNELIHQVHKNNEYFRHRMKEKSIVNNVTLCAGICPICYGDDLNVAIDNANLARKNIGEGESLNCKFFDQEMKNRIHREIEIEDSMEAALDNREFVLYLQPKIDLNTGRISGAEALVRWQRTPDEILPPNDFIPIFERNGFIVELDYFIYEEVCKILMKWKEEERKIIPISVNVSRIHLNDDGFVEKIKNLVEEYRIPPSWLELELTESIFLMNKDVALSMMRELREYGFYVSIDDFGAGYSSLNLLKDMNTDVLKLDKEFFRSGTMNREDKIIVSSIVSMAKQLHMKVLSEGIETKSQSEFLQSIDCDMAQGYLFSRPVPLEEFEKLVTG